VRTWALLANDEFRRPIGWGARLLRLLPNAPRRPISATSRIRPILASSRT